MKAARNPLLTAFSTRLERDPSALVAVGGGRRLSAAALDALATALAARLPETADGRVVGLRAPNGPAFLAGWLALLRRGAAPLLHDCRQPPAEAARTAAALGARGLLFAAGAWPDSAADFHWTDLAPTHEDIAGAALGAIKLTSGSTGAPRGIAVTAEALLADDEHLWISMGLARGERMLTAIPLSHSYGLASLAIPALVRDATLVLAEGGGPLAPLEAGAANGATFFPTSPAWLAPLSRLREPPRFPASLRLVISAGEPLPPETAARLRQRFGRRVHVFYGSSETGGITYDRDGGAAERGTVGTPVDGVTVTVDERDGRVVVGSAAVGATYLPDPDPRLAGGVFTTGDLGAWSERGELQLLGRADDLVFVKGKSVNPRAVEAVLRQIPGVDDAAALAVAGPHGGGQQLRAVIAAPAGRVSGTEAVAFCRARLADHQVPRSVVVVRELPRGERGKVDRAALRALVPG